MTTEQRLRRFALHHILRCGSDTEARRTSDHELEQRCMRCQRTHEIRVRPGENPNQFLHAMHVVQTTAR